MLFASSAVFFMLLPQILTQLVDTLQQFFILFLELLHFVVQPTVVGFQQSNLRLRLFMLVRIDISCHPVHCGLDRFQISSHLINVIIIIGVKMSSLIDWRGRATTEF